MALIPYLSNYKVAAVTLIRHHAMKMYKAWS